MSETVRIVARTLAVAAALAALVWLGPGTSHQQPITAQAVDPCAVPVTNPVACENTLPGAPQAEWDVTGAGDASIQGFATDISVNRGETVRFKVDTAASSYRLDIYRLGYYGGAGARKVATVLPSAPLPQAQPACSIESTTGLVDCGIWQESASWSVPESAVSGIYVAKLVRTDATPGASHVVFVVRDDTGESDLLFQTSDTTWQAYNRYGGNSLYVGSPAGRAYKVSYNRPFTTRAYAPEDWLFNAEYPMVRWLEANGYDVSYTTGIDMDRAGGEIVEHKAFLSVGHDEYWSADQRASVEAARDAGVHLAFFSGNEVFWKTRFEPSIDGSGTAHRTLVCYKDTHANAKIDPLGGVWTGTWRDPRFSPPNDGGRPENALTGTLFTVNAPASTSMAIQVPAAFAGLRFWRNTSVASLEAGQTATLAGGTLGYEWDEAVENGAQPNGLVRLSRTTGPVSKLQDYGTTYAPGTATHALTLYRSAGGALVFGAGTVQWSWGLDGSHDRGGSVPDLRMQQATVNLFADMGVQPLTPDSQLVAAVASSDSLPPASAITAPAPGATLLAGAPVNITGTATDAGGLVAGVEVSTDGGQTWRAATGTSAWTYSWVPAAPGTRLILSRAVDDSGNVETPAPGVSVTVTASLPDACPCSLWSDAVMPTVTDAGLDSPVELGVKFTSTVNGYITGLRFYKSAANTGTHVGSLWTATGTRLGSLTFPDETESGWQTANFDTPVAVSANTTYVASYHTRVGHYAYGSQYFATAAVTSGPLRAPAATTTPNGVYKYGNAGTFPTESFRATNYWVDVVFNTTPDTTDTTAPVVASTSPAPGASNVSITAAIAAVFSEALDTATIGSTTFELRTSGGTLVPATVAYSAASRTATLTPTAPMVSGATYTATLFAGIADLAGNTLPADFVWTFAVVGDTTPPSVSSVTPATGATGVSSSAVVRAVFNEPVAAATVAGNTFELRDASNNVVLASVGYDPATRTATLLPTSPLAALTTYTATVRGGATDPRVKDLEGNALAANVTWSFTTAAAAPSGCPCTLFPSTATPAVIDGFDGRPVELGVKFRSDSDGYITGIRFYKSAANTGTHKGSLWSATGTLLASVTFTGETASGWQQANFATPVAIQANTVYVASYHAPVGRYSFSSAAFNLGLDNPPLHALANSVSPNGVYRYSAASAFPTDTYNSGNYWVDVVYSATPGSADTTPPVVSAVSPVGGAVGIGTGTSISATFSEALNESTIGGATFELRDAANALVAASVSWTASSRTAILQPAAPLQYATTYTARLKGGAAAPHVTDTAGNAMAADHVWSFTTGAAPVTPPTDGPGGPILVVTDPSNPFGRYYGEILKAEGLNAFAIADVSTLTPAALAGYDVVILSEIALTPAQVDLFANWVAGGGNLVAMRPDKKLASLLGLADAGSTLANGYLQFGATGPGAGLVQEPIQFHGTADRYTLDGAAALATLFADATTSTVNPAVSLRTLAAGGQAAAFAYDLARSVIYTRQGNPAWASQDRDGNVVVRSNDMFFGAAAGDPQADWVDFAKVAIPQADEQMRLLKNLVIQMTLARKPLPSFWYFPRGLKAVVVMTGDDHARGGTAGRFDAQKAASAPGCSVNDWECIRSTSYVYPETPLTAAQIAAYTADGFEIALHVTNGCANTNAVTLDSYVTEQLGRFFAAFPGAPAPATSRTHCVPWNDYTSQASVELSHGIRMDTTYYYWPDTWIADRPGLFTGSGMPMRFAKATGETIDVYQAVTQMTDESGQTFPKNIDALLDKALGPEGYYGAFVANMHTDLPSSVPADQIIAAARARNVPVISAKQLLTWLDGRNASSFQSIEWATNLPNAPLGGSTLRFTINVASGANGLEALVPRRLVEGASVLTALTRNGIAVDPAIRTIKGIEYAVFAAAPGDYVATYDTTPPVTTLMSAPAPRTNATEASVAFSANEAGSTFECRLDGAAFAPCSSPFALSGLAEGAHTVEVRATDIAGNVAATPAAASWTIDLSPPSVTGRTPAPDAVGVALNTAVVVQFDEAVSPSTVTAATLRIRKVGAASDLPATVSLGGTSATLHPSSGLALGSQYEVTLDAGVSDTAGNVLGAPITWRFTTNGQLVDTTAADFAGGTVDAGGRVTATGDGEVMLAAAEGSDFTGTTLPAGWSSTAWNPGGTSAVSGGALTVNAARAHPAGLYAAGRALEFYGTFANDSYQHVGFGVSFQETPWAIFSTYLGGGLWVRTHNGFSAINTQIPGNWLGTPHLYRIEWNAASVVYFIDGVQVASHPLAIGGSMRPIVSDINSTPTSVRVEWLRMTPYAAGTTYLSRVFDGGSTTNWGALAWTADLPAGTSLVVSVRTGDTAVPDASWTPFADLAVSGASIGQTGRYTQYRLVLATTNPATSPAVRSVTVSGSVQ